MDPEASPAPDVSAFGLGQSDGRSDAPRNTKRPLQDASSLLAASLTAVKKRGFCAGGAGWLRGEREEVQKPQEKPSSRLPFHKNLPFPHGQAIALAAPHFLDHHAAGSIAIVVAGALANARHVTNREIQIREL